MLTYQPVTSIAAMYLKAELFHEDVGTKIHAARFGFDVEQRFGFDVM
jgi:hypothetical protein